MIPNLANTTMSKPCRQKRVIFSFRTDLAHQSHEKATRKPPPPGAAPAPDVSVMMVPALTGDPAVTVHVEPEAAAVVQLTMREAAAHVFDAVLGVTE